MKLFLSTLKGIAYLYPALLMYALSAKYIWQPSAYLVSFPRLFSFLCLSLLILYVIHFQLVKKNNYWQRSLFWLWTGPFFIIILGLAYLRERSPQKSKNINYFINDLCCLLLYILSMVVLTLTYYESVTNQMLFEYKKKHIKKEMMYYKKDWGWVDKVHYRPDHFQEVLSAINSGDSEITLHDGWITPLRIPVSYQCTYQFKAAETEIKRWAQAAAISLHFMELNERVQDESPWFHGNQLSAWQFDDLSSGFLACINQCPDPSLRANGEEIHDITQILTIWDRDGHQQVLKKMNREACWHMVNNDKIKKLIEQAQWSVKDLIIKH